MKFTPEILRRHAEVLVEKQTKGNRSIVAAYLRGSLLYGSPLMGRAGDIDLVFIHNSPPLNERQIIRLTPEIHFDIVHHDEVLYQTPRKLRLDPWMGPTLQDAVPLHDPRHIVDYTQSGVRSNFFYPENIQARAKPLLDSSRQFWLDRQISPPQEMTAEFPAFLNALEAAVNAVALLSGPPLPIRRLGIDFPQRAANLNAAGLAIAFDHLLGSVALTTETLQSWIKSWQKAMDYLKSQPETLPFLIEEQTYFQSAFDQIVSGSKPGAALWPLLVTWTRIISAFPNETQLQVPWIKTLTALGFAGKDYQTKIEAFDSFLEMCETLVLGENASDGGA